MVALGVLAGAVVLIVVDPDDGAAWLVAALGAVSVLILPAVVVLVLNLRPSEEEREPYSAR